MRTPCHSTLRAAGADVLDLRLAAAALDHPGGRTENVGEKALTGGGTKADSRRGVQTLRTIFEETFVDREPWRDKGRQIVMMSAARGTAGVMIIAVVLSGCGSGPASTGVLTGRTSPKGPITGQQAIAIVEKDGRVVLGTAPPSCHCAHPYQELAGIKRIAAKLTTFEGLLALANPGALVPGSPESGSDRVWVVAVSAIVHPSMGLTREKTDTWAVSVIDQHTGEEVEFTAGATGNWPPFFDALPDLSHA